MRAPHRLPDGTFRNPWPGGTPTGQSGLLKWMWQRWKTPQPPDPPASAFERVAPSFAPREARDAIAVTWIGHSTLLLQVGGVNVLTDPVWAERASPVPFAGPARWVPPGVALEALPPIDVLLLSHNHYDHFDVATLRALAARQPAMRWVVPLGLAAAVAPLGARDVHELDWWDERRLTTDGGDLTVGCTPAQHFSARGLHDRNRTLWCGWALAVGAHRVFFAGDTGLHPEFGAIARRWGPFALAALPVGAYEPRWFMRPVHMNPDDARAAWDAMAAEHPGHRGAMVPIHWGTFKLTDEPMDEPMRRTRALWPDDALVALRHGETRRLQRR